MDLFTGHSVESTARFEPTNLSFVHRVQKTDLFFASVLVFDLTSDCLKKYFEVFTHPGFKKFNFSACARSQIQVLGKLATSYQLSLLGGLLLN